MSPDYEDLPLVYSCSGCSSAAQMANDLAIRLDHQGEAEMSCIAGVGGDVAPLVNTATSGRPTVVLDGCPLTCAKASLEQHGVKPDRHVNLAELGVPKEYHVDYDDALADAVFDDLVQDVKDLQPST